MEWECFHFLTKDETHGYLNNMHAGKKEICQLLSIRKNYYLGKNGPNISAGIVLPCVHHRARMVMTTIFTATIFTITVISYSLVVPREKKNKTRINFFVPFTDTSEFQMHFENIKKSLLSLSSFPSSFRYKVQNAIFFVDLCEFTQSKEKSTTVNTQWSTLLVVK